MKIPRKSHKLRILVEGHTDRAVVDNILQALGSDIHQQVEVEVCDGKKA